MRTVFFAPNWLTLFATLTIFQSLSATGNAKQVKLDVGLGHPNMLLDDGGKGTNYLRIALTGFELESDKVRPPVNVAIVIDRSGSMSGEKIERAREAAEQAVQRLRSIDIVSIVTYDDSVNVVVPATKLTDKEDVIQKIRGITPGGSTALHAGVSKGGDEVQKFYDKNNVNRVILLSDGLANVGPASPEELEKLGEQLLEKGITVSTMGLGSGYNEDLMSRLALAGSGNHVFIENADNLVQVFQREFDDALSVVASDFHIRAVLGEGIRPVKVLNYPAKISGQQVSIDLGQLVSQQQRYFVVEIEVPFGKPGSKRQAATVDVEYRNLVTSTTDKLSSSVEVKFTKSSEEAEKEVDKEVLAACVIQVANERNREATRLRDDGNVDGARQALIENSTYLSKAYETLGVPELKRRDELNKDQASKLEGPDWGENRKAMREMQMNDSSQQLYYGSGASSDYKK